MYRSARPVTDWMGFAATQ